MSFFEKVDAVREKPERERRRLALVWTGALMVPVVLFWAVTKTLPGIHNSDSAEPTSAIERSGLGASVFSIWQEVKQGAGLIQEQIKTLQETTITTTH